MKLKGLLCNNLYTCELFITDIYLQNFYYYSFYTPDKLIHNSGSCHFFRLNIKSLVTTTLLNRTNIVRI